MLKSALYYMMVFSTSVQLLNLFYLMTKKTINLPIPVLVLSGIFILFGLFMVVKRFVNMLRMKQIMSYYIAQIAVVTFNMIYIAVACPLKITMSEMMVSGTFLNIIVCVCAVYACIRQMRSGYAPVIQVMNEGKSATGSARQTVVGQSVNV